MKPFDRNKSLQQLEGKDWGKPAFDSRLVQMCHRLRRIPLRDFTVEDLRVMIGQNIGLEFLVPLALERLNDNPCAEGIYYPCDLLVSVLSLDRQFWQGHPDLNQQLGMIAERTMKLFPTVPDGATKTVVKAVTKAYNEFRRHEKSENNKPSKTARME